MNEPKNINVEEEIRSIVIIACAKYHKALLNHEELNSLDKVADKAVEAVDEAIPPLLRLVFPGPPLDKEKP